MKLLCFASRDAENIKRLVSLRLDPEVIDGFKATGRGWQSRVNRALRSHLGLEDESAA
jgi:uncharacterized protein (DUF4415 family)